MAPERKRETRGNQVYNVGVQGRKTGITLEDKGVRDEYGMEPISAIFSSPAKSPPKRSASQRQTGGTVTDSESMDLESSVPNLTPGRLLRGNVPNLPPPKSRSPMKTALGSSPRRQSSMGPRAQGQDTRSSGSSRAASHPAVSRRLDFEQDESSLQETPALSGSGTRRGRARRDVYELEEGSPSQPRDSVVEESMVQEDVTMEEDSAMINGVAEESFAGIAAEDSVAGATAENIDVTVEEDTVVVESVKQPAKRGRKRKSDAIATPAEDESPAPLPKRRGPATTKASAAAKEKEKEKSQSAAPKPRRAGRPKRVSEITEEGPSTILEESPGASDLGKKSSTPKPRGRPPKNQVDESLMDSEQAEEASAPVRKGRGRPAKAQTEKGSSASKEAPQPVFKKPKAIAKPKGKADAKTDVKAREKTAELASGRLVNSQGLPLTKDEIEQMSTTSTTSRFGRGRSLSIFRQLAPDEVGRVPTTGRHKMQPVNWWANERAQYTKEGSLKALIHREEDEELPRKYNSRRKTKGKKKSLDAIEEEDEDELEEWEKEEGVLTGNYQDFDPETDTTADAIVDGAIAWAPKGIQPQTVASGEFKFIKLASTDSAYFSFGFIEMDKDGVKRPKNSRRMHMVFHVTQGAVEATLDHNILTVHRGGVFHVPRGNMYSIKNVAKGVSRVFFAQSFESRILEEE